jgi:hypothetical protein
MNSDAFFSIGKTHEVCQDYARTGNIAGRQFAIVSDGCSSSPDTDFGARFLTMAAAQCIARFPNEDLKEEWIIWQAEAAARMARLSLSCLDATLLVATCGPEVCPEVFVYGDGVVIAGGWDGSLDVWDLDFAGAPGYLSYLLDTDRKYAYKEAGYGTRTEKHYHKDAGATEWVLVNSFTYSFNSNPGWYNGFSPDAAFVVLVSDGIHSFQRSSDLQPIPMLDIVPHLVDFKSFTGQFVSRRCRAFDKFCAKEGWHHNDDLGVAAIHFPKPDEG